MYLPGSSYYKVFTTSDATGAAADATGTPVATANRNGTDDGAFALTVARLDLGRYKATGTVPSGYAALDVVNVSVAATVAGIAAKDVIDTFVLDGYPEPLIKPHQALGLILDALVAKLSGVPAASVPGTIVIRDVHDAADRISIDVDGDGNRTGLTMNAPP